MSEQKPSPRRQIFVLTAEEKKTIVFVLCAFVLGLTTKHYRETHPRPPPPPTAKEQRAAKKITRVHSAGPSPAPTPSAVTPSPRR